MFFNNFKSKSHYVVFCLYLLLIITHPFKANSIPIGGITKIIKGLSKGSDLISPGSKMVKPSVTDEAIKKSLINFEKHYKIFDQQLQNQKFLLGDYLSVLDIAWFIYTYRLIISEFPFKQKYPNVYKWYNLLYARNEFYKEVKPPFIFYLVRKISLLKARLSKTAIHNFVS